MSDASKRSVKLKVTTQKDLIKVESSARTFGELKSELSNVKWDGMRVVVRETKNTLQDDGAVLPGGDFILFLVPEKVKSGMAKKSLKNIATASYNDLRSHASHLNKKKNAGIPVTGGTEQIRKAVQAYYDKMNPAKAAKEAPAEDAGNVDEAKAVIENAGAKIKEAIDVILANAGVTRETVVEDTTEYALKVSMDDIDSEFAQLKKALKL